MVVWESGLRLGVTQWEWEKACGDPRGQEAECVGEDWGRQTCARTPRATTHHPLCST